MLVEAPPDKKMRYNSAGLAVFYLLTGALNKTAPPPNTSIFFDICSLTALPRSAPLCAANAAPTT